MQELAEKIAKPMAHCLAEFEHLHQGARDAKVLEARITSVWSRIASDALQGGVSLSSAYLSALHKALKCPDSTVITDAFQEGSYPNDWSTFTSGFRDANEGKIQGCEAWLLAQLCWGKHFGTLSYSLAWLCLNGLRLQEGLYPIFPPIAQFDRLVIALAAAAPPCSDAETLRALMGEYDKSQTPFGWSNA